MDSSRENDTRVLFFAFFSLTRADNITFDVDVDM